MVLIYSERSDQTTNEVVAWLNLLGCKVVRLNTEEKKHQLIRINLDNDEIIISDGSDEINLLNVKSIWYRRRGISWRFLNLQINAENLKQILPEKNQESYIRTILFNEVDTILEYIYYKLEKQCDILLGSHFNSDVNKLKILDMAKDAGFNIPATCLLNKKDALLDYIDQQHGIITKALSNGIYRFATQNAYYTYTEKITPQSVSNIDREFFFSLFQQQIEKKIEIRVFYFTGKCYSMAIFSQSNENTKVDFRRSVNHKDNRYVPYILPVEIEEKIKKLMNLISLDTGSIDLILDTNGDYYFLEVNPVGQFGMVSYPCNYYLEKMVAKYLKYEKKGI